MLTTRGIIILISYIAVVEAPICWRNGATRRRRLVLRCCCDIHPTISRSRVYTSHTHVRTSTSQRKNKTYLYTFILLLYKLRRGLRLHRARHCLSAWWLIDEDRRCFFKAVRLFIKKKKRKKSLVLFLYTHKTKEERINLIAETRLTRDTANNGGTDKQRLVVRVKR